MDLLATGWGTADLVGATNPERATDRAYLEEVATWNRFAATPRTAAAQYRYLLGSVDVRQALPLIQTPTRVLHVKESAIVPVEHGRYLADHIDGATLVELPGGSLPPTTHMTQLIDELVEFLTGERPPVAIETRAGHGDLHRHRGLHRNGRGDRRPTMAPTPRRARRTDP